MVALGEALWDVFPDQERFGGAPANFACAAAALAGDRARVHMVSAVGMDALGRRALAALTRHGVMVDTVYENHRPTGRVRVSLDPAGSPHYEIEADAAWDHVTLEPAAVALAGRAHVVCFGSLAQRSSVTANTIRACLDATHADAMRLFDVNLRPPHDHRPVIERSLALCNTLKLNAEELAVLRRSMHLPADDVGAIRSLAHAHQLRAVALTRGSEGATLLRGDEVSHAPGSPIRVVNTVGAGDAFTARFALGLLDDEPLDELNRQACDVAAEVCGSAGAIPDRTSR